MFTNNVMLYQRNCRKETKGKPTHMSTNKASNFICFSCVFTSNARFFQRNCHSKPRIEKEKKKRKTKRKPMSHPKLLHFF